MTYDQLKAMKRSEFLRWSIGQFALMREDSNYLIVNDYIHRHADKRDNIAPEESFDKTKVHACFAGVIPRFFKGKEYNCTPANLFQEPWVPHLYVLLGYRRGFLRNAFPGVNDKLYKKFLPHNYCLSFVPVTRDNDPRLVDELRKIAIHLEEAGL